MYRHVFAALALSATGIVSANAEPLSLSPQRHAQYVNRPAPGYVAPGSVAPSSVAPSYAAPRPEAAIPAERSAPVRYVSTESDVNLGGGFIEFLFSGGRAVAPPRPPGSVMGRGDPVAALPEMNAEQSREIDPKYHKQLVDYAGSEPAGTIIIDTPQRFLFLVQGNGKALRYGIGVGKPGFTWAGEKKVTAKKEWPDWVPPPEMLQRRPDLPHFMAGGPENPLGARAMYLGTSLYRIHGSNEPWTIGQAVSSGCIRMRNEDVIDLYDRVKVGTKVVVI
ncbi:MAG: L,D-transpeptidase [Xanthobacteraceae bacterium]|nr:L,D-transpeptidase [Xanthobacteraceae bacterium]